MKVKSLAPWFGGKRTLAPRIITELGKHTQYFEPTCGAMSVLLAKKPSQKETACDLHGDITNLARVVAEKEHAVVLYDRLQAVLYAEDLLDRARQVLSQEVEFCDDKITAEMVDRAYWYFLASWMGRNGTAGTERQDYQIAVRWTKGGGSPTVRFRSAVDSIPWWHRRLQNVVILRRNCFTLIDRIEDVKETAMYFDPPYTPETRSKFAVKNGRGGRYVYEFKHGTADGQMLLLEVAEEEEEDQHADAAEILRSYKHARIVVSYYDCERIRELYEGWTFIDCSRQKHLHAQNGRGKRKLEAPEVLIVNGPAYGEN